MDTELIPLPLGSLDKDIIVIHVKRMTWKHKEEDESHQHAVPGPVMIMPMGRPRHAVI